MRSLRRQVIDHDVQSWARQFLDQLYDVGRPVAPERPVVRLAEGEDSDPDQVDAAIEHFARTPRILVASDFDGVLAPIVADRDAVRPEPASMAALRELTELPGVNVALVSGRALEDLERHTQMPSSVALVGSHGAEVGALPPSMRADVLDSAALSMDEHKQGLLDSITRRLEHIASQYPGTEVELKPSAAVLHTRRALGRGAGNATDAALEYARTLPDVHVRPGKEVVEFSVIHSSKGLAVRTLSRASAADAVFYVGDDVTDETVFDILEDQDLGIKVGDGDTAAAYRVQSPEDVARILSRLRDERARVRD